MPQKPAPKDARKRTKKPGKIANLPAKSLKGKDAAAVKGGVGLESSLKIGGVIATGKPIAPISMNLDKFTR